MNDGITSPPYPSSTSNSRSLFKHLEDLRTWVSEQRVILTPIIPPKFVQHIDNIPLLRPSSWDYVSVVDKYLILTHMRSVREGWDAVLREQEDAWDSTMAIRRRFNLVSYAIMILENSCIDPETQEHKQLLANQKAERRRKIIDKHLRDVLVPDELKDEVDEIFDEGISNEEWMSSFDAPAEGDGPFNIDDEFEDDEDFSQ